MEGKSYLRFAKLAQFYDHGVRLLGLPLGGEKSVREKVLALLPLQQGDRVLEIGCGIGTVTLMAALRVGVSGTAVGVDPSPEMLEQGLAAILADACDERLREVGTVVFAGGLAQGVLLRHDPAKSDRLRRQ